MPAAPPSRAARVLLPVATIVWGGVILATVSVAPAIWVAYVLPRLGPRPLDGFVAAGFVGGAALVAWAWRSSPARRNPALGFLVLVAVLYAALLFGYYAGEKPVKRFHLLEYAPLALLALEAAAVHRTAARPRFPFVVAVVFCVVVGTVDESLQGFIPGRTFRWHDLLGNFLAFGLGALAWWAASGRSPFRAAAAAIVAPQAVAERAP